MKVFFRDKLKSYCLVIALGITLQGFPLYFLLNFQTIAYGHFIIGVQVHSDFGCFQPL